MRNKKFIESLLSAITIAAIASQFVGCSSASRSEAAATKSEPAKQEAQETPSALLQMLQENKEIEIEITKPVSMDNGETTLTEVL